MTYALSHQDDRRFHEHCCGEASEDGVGNEFAACDDCVPAAWRHLGDAAGLDPILDSGHAYAASGMSLLQPGLQYNYCTLACTSASRFKDDESDKIRGTEFRHCVAVPSYFLLATRRKRCSRSLSSRLLRPTGLDQLRASLGIAPWLLTRYMCVFRRVIAMRHGPHEHCAHGR